VQDFYGIAIGDHAAFVHQADTAADRAAARRSCNTRITQFAGIGHLAGQVLQWLAWRMSWLAVISSSSTIGVILGQVPCVHHPLTFAT
jgi:hypothetical protein